jgi:hypothetical protein
VKFGVRKFSPKKRIAARTSVKRVIRHNLGVKAPRGWGWLTDPKKAAYNRVYNRGTIGADKATGFVVLVLVTLAGGVSWCVRNRRFDVLFAVAAATAACVWVLLGRGR